MIELSVVNDGNSDISAVNPTVIKIIGCGGGGSNAVNRMIDAGVNDVEFIVMNTDLQALGVSKAQKRLAIGQKLTGGLGAGGNPEVGESAAKEDTDNINNIVQGADMVVITAGMGGGTGTGSAPVVAELAKAAGALTIGVVTTPFGFEGPVRMRNAQDGLKKLRENVDSLIIVPNEQIMKNVNKRMSFKQAFRLADDVLCQGVQGISEIITLPGEMNVDFADVRSVMSNQGDAILGVGFGEGENRANEAALSAISNPMLADCQIDGASNILVNIVCDEDEETTAGMSEIEEIIKTISVSASKNVNIISGICTKHGMGDKIAVTVIATGFKKPEDDNDPYSTSDNVRKSNDNVIDYGSFEKVLHSGPAPVTASQKEQPVMTDAKLSTINLKQESLDVLKKPAEPPVKLSENVAVQPAAIKKPAAPATISETLKKPGEAARLQPPIGTRINKDDINQPAAWRNLDGLSREIKLSNGK